ncbi:unnamed protein product, partial [Timema podura]|nr:unnamed protein product [Timema podura]
MYCHGKRASERESGWFEFDVSLHTRANRQTDRHTYVRKRREVKLNQFLVIMQFCMKNVGKGAGADPQRGNGVLGVRGYTIRNYFKFGECEPPRTQSRESPPLTKILAASLTPSHENPRSAPLRAEVLLVEQDKRAVAQEVVSWPNLPRLSVGASVPEPLLSPGFVKESNILHFTLESLYHALPRMTDQLTYQIMYQAVYLYQIVYQVIYPYQIMYQVIYPYQIMYQVIHPYQIMHQVIYPHQIMYQVIHPYQIMFQVIYPYQIMYQVIYPYQIMYQVIHPYQIMFQVIYTYKFNYQFIYLCQLNYQVMTDQLNYQVIHPYQFMSQAATLLPPGTIKSPGREFRFESGERMDQPDT